MTATPRGQLFVISAPSGAGKTSLIKALRERRPELALSVSHTTRPRRDGEVNGEHYHFVDISQFEAMLAQEAFVEHAKVFDNYYGTSKAAISEQLDHGYDLILEIDWQGAAQVKKLFPEAIFIFILPPSTAELEARLRNRASDDDEVIARRLAEARREMQQCHWYDYLVINDDFDRSLEELDALFTAAMLETDRQRERHPALIADLLGEVD
ncbi:MULTISPECIES: guanylate kinase [unclassified Guyparkeria]|uniref:guanylate kinase n=1 Tax=unclassified Guyparkeria TaxID=2626246 RepID=UPI0007336EFC|nr:MULTISPECIES: guanylate kinase [unclassified Guyparkeria]KTG16727.1 guanylate kinase [Guyparkeria sp. XI15]OAE85761.1 guanylate kinase [Guyparkeria sp. WRN-7]